MSDKPANQIIIEVERGCYNLASPIPDGVELVIKDYDVIEDPTSKTQKSDSNGFYEEIIHDHKDSGYRTTKAFKKAGRSKHEL